MQDKAECGHLTELLPKLGEQLDKYLRFEHPDAQQNNAPWKTHLGRKLPEQGIGIEQVIEEMGEHLIPNGSQIPNPGCSAFITTGATSVAAIATLSGAVASPQRFGLTAFNFLESLSLQWMAQMFELSSDMQGIYSSGGSVANLVALGAARQSAFERIGIDPALDGIQKKCRIYTSCDSHHTIHRAAAILGLGRSAVIEIPVDAQGRLCPDALEEQLRKDSGEGFLPVAVVATAGVTSTGAIDPLQEIGNIAQENNIWFHVDGAYGLPGILDPQVKANYLGLSMADSVVVDPHKWLGAPVGIGVTYVRDYQILQRAFTQGASDYLEGSFVEGSFVESDNFTPGGMGASSNIQSSMDSMGIPYSDFGVELSAPSRGAVVWAIIREIGKIGLQERVCRHNAMARQIALRAHQHPHLEVVQEPTLSICCFRYIDNQCNDLNELNRRIHRKLVHNGNNIPSTAQIGDTLCIRPCFVGARSHMQHAMSLVDEVISIGNELSAHYLNNNDNAQWTFNGESNND